MNRRFAAACLALALLYGAAATASEKEALREARERLEQLRRDLSKSESERERAVDQLRASEKAISAANRKLRELQAAQRNAETELKRLTQETAELSDRIADGRERLSRMLRARYMAGTHTPLKLLLSGEEQGDAARRLTYQAYVSRAQADFIRSLEADVDRLAALRESTEARREELARLEAEQRQERESLDAQRAERRTVLARISDDVRARRKEVEAARRDEARLARVVDKLAKAATARAQARAKATRKGTRNEQVPEAFAADVKFTALKGRLRLPVRGELVNRFGTPRQDSGLIGKGVFIRARAGEEVRAVANGEVVYADWLRGFGNLLILDHGAGYMTIYGHNEAVLKRPGDLVRAGDVVATVGATGGSQTAGLYFEMRHQGRPFDPLSWVKLK